MTADAPAHAKLAPSDAPRWGPDGCPASPAMQRKYPEDDESPEAREGTAAHWVALDMMLGYGITPALGTLAPNGHPVTQEMLDGPLALLDDIRDTVTCASPGMVVRIEERVDAAGTIHPDNWGTPDAYLLDRPNQTLHVWDYKFGHRPVDAYQNWQLIDYAACILESEGVAYGALADWHFTFTIGQPRSFSPDGPLREWHPHGRELIPLINRLRTAAHEASKPDAPCITGKHCRDCLAEWDCRANQLVGGASIDVAYAQQSTGMDAPALGLEKCMIETALQRLNARNDSLDARILGLVRSGQDVPFWGLGWTKPRPAWRKGMRTAAVSIGAMFGLEFVKPDLGGVVTPNEAGKMLTAIGIDESVITQYAETPPGSAKLVARDDREAARVFGTR